jgi:hypothetical protein
MVYAFVMELGGPRAAVFLSLALTLVSGLAFLRLRRLAEA